MTPDLAVMNSARGAAHRQLTADRTRCGERILPDTVRVSLLACEVHRIPICTLCWPQDRRGPRHPTG